MQRQSVNRDKLARQGEEITHPLLPVLLDELQQLAPFRFGICDLLVPR